MKKIITKLSLTILVLMFSGCFGEQSQTKTSNNNTTGLKDDDIINFEKKRISLTTSLDMKNIKIFLKQKVEVDGWNAYVLSLQLKSDEREFETKDILFSDGKAITTELYDPKTSRSYKEKIEIKLPQSVYDDSHIIAGNKDAKHKVVLFSDPLCPFCIEYVPEVISFVKNNPTKIALYYFHFPLVNIHPSAMILSQAMIKLHLDNKIDNMEIKTYQAKFENSFDPRETNPKIVLNAFNKALNSKLSLDDINQKVVLDILKKDMKVASDSLVSGTPTVFINGKIDKTRNAYKKLK
ncbi:MAG: disulfide bond formation protein DsbA [Epsilonproteobacteria bacterium]|nr:MAG: disulfide bond formation protein DsbA [Campylobacterota bacterium]